MKRESRHFSASLHEGLSMEPKVNTLNLIFGVQLSVFHFIFYTSDVISIIITCERMYSTDGETVDCIV